MPANPPAGWLSLKAAGARFDRSDQTMGKWIEKGTFTADEVIDLGEGHRQRHFISTEAVNRVARDRGVASAQRAPTGVTPSMPATPAQPPGALPDPVPDLDARIVALEDIARRQNIIDDCRQEIERLHAEIERQLKEINQVSTGPGSVPNH